MFDREQGQQKMKKKKKMNQIKLNTLYINNNKKERIKKNVC